MRLISFDGIYDVLYDNVILVPVLDAEDKKFRITATLVSNAKTCFAMGEYSTEDEMSKEWNNLHRKYELMNTAVYVFGTMAKEIGE